MDAPGRIGASNGGDELGADGLAELPEAPVRWEAERAVAPRGRGTAINPGNRFEGVRLHVLPEHAEEVVSQSPDGRRVRTLVYADRSRTVINPVDVPDIHFRWSINPYRGCEHGCVYCYARPTHEYLGLSSGLDFETKIVAKRDAPALVRRELSKPSWRGERIMMSGVTDPYQPVEASLRITRGVLEAMAEFRQPVSVITKNRLIARDADVLGELARHGAAHAAVSLTTLDNTLAARMEPRASAPGHRLEAIAALARAGVPVRVMTGPLIPGVNDHEVPALLQAAAEAGATSAGYTLLRLPWQVKEVFLEWLERTFPQRAAKVESLVRQTRAGALYDSRFGQRQSGSGPVARAIGDMWRLAARRAGLVAGDRTGALDHEADASVADPRAGGGKRVTPFRRPLGGAADGHMGLFAGL